MARLAKNPQISPGALAVKLPVVDTSLADTPTDGLLRFNTDNSRIEFYYGSGWKQVAKIGRVDIVVDTIGPGDDTTQIFFMTQAETDPAAIAVFIGGVYQKPDINYTLGDGTPGIKTPATTTIVFASPPPSPGINPNEITVIHNLNSTDTSG